MAGILEVVSLAAPLPDEDGAGDEGGAHGADGGEAEHAEHAGEGEGEEPGEEAEPVLAGRARRRIQPGAPGSSLVANTTA